MPELRTDWLTGRSVLIAENRALRPNDFATEPAQSVDRLSQTRSQASCPFCAGNESRTPAAVYEKRDEEGNWQVRVVPNMFPAVELPMAGLEMPPVDFAKGPSAGDVWQMSPAVGAHEIIIESPRHADRMSALSIAELRNVLEAYAERLRHWRADGRFQYGLVFKNQGPRAGASIAHLHSQLIALRFVPAAIEAEQVRAAQAYSKQQQCPSCRMIARELSDGERIVLQQDGFVAFCPFVSWQPYEVWLMPTAHQPSFESAISSELNRLSRVLHQVLGLLEAILPDAEYNLLLRTAPWIGGGNDWSHWRIEMMPRMNSFAGLEIATEIHINHVPPERAARRLLSQ